MARRRRRRQQPLGRTEEDGLYDGHFPPLHLVRSHERLKV